MESATRYSSEQIEELLAQNRRMAAMIERQNAFHEERRATEEARRPKPVALAHWWEECQETKAHGAKSYHAKMRKTYEIVRCVLGSSATTEQLDDDLVRRFKKAGNWPSPNTTRSYVRTLRTMINVAIKARWLEVGPDWSELLPKESKGREVHYSQAEIEAALRLARLAWTIERDPRERWVAARTCAMTWMAAFSAMRRGEILTMYKEDIDFKNRLILIPERDGRRLKTKGSFHPVGLPPQLEPVLHEWIAMLDAPWPPAASRISPAPAAKIAMRRPVDGRWLFPNAYGTGHWEGGGPGYKPLDRMKAIGVAAGIEKPFHFQGLRHSWATHAEAWGLGQAAIQRQLRHERSETQSHYREHDAANVRAFALKIGLNPDAPDPRGGSQAG